SQSIPDLIAGNVQVVMGEVSTTVPGWRGGLIHLLATPGRTARRWRPISRR
ncbi:MAG: hypothetical protein JWP04_3239, partial [Belnapia sp.]|nr:hypothetical protein [Belnapia sp.]